MSSIGDFCVCRRCHKVFTLEHVNQHYCSKECALASEKEARKIRNAQYRAEHKKHAELREDLLYLHLGNESGPEALLFSVLMMAAFDYQNALIGILKGKDKGGCYKERNMKTDCETFFRGPVYGSFCSIPGNRIIQEIRKKVGYVGE